MFYNPDKYLKKATGLLAGGLLFMFLSVPVQAQQAAEEAASPEMPSWGQIPSEDEERSSTPEIYRELQNLKTLDTDSPLPPTARVPGTEVPEKPEVQWDSERVLQTTRDLKQYETDTVVSGVDAAEVTQISQQIQEIKKIQRDTYSY